MITEFSACCSLSCSLDHRGGLLPDNLVSIRSNQPDGNLLRPMVYTQGEELVYEDV